MTAPTILARMTETGGRSTGFDYLRILLALGVIAWHSLPLSYGAGEAALARASVLSYALSDLILPMFFALSGFLVAGSLDRNSIVTFVGLRVIRLAPALAVEVFLSALLLGPLLTAFTVREYFTDPLFYRYFLNIIGEIQYRLPGLFLTNPFPNVVNGQLWTVPWELKCYAVLTILAILGLVKKRTTLVIITVTGTAALWAWYAFGNPVWGGTPLLIGFIAGVAVHRYKDVLPWSAGLAAGCAVLVGWLIYTKMGYLAAFPTAYLTVYIGLTNPRKIGLLRGADYSYGLYLYGFAIQQAVAAVLPWSREWYWNLAISLPIACVFAAFSWHLVEKPALRLRGVLAKFDSFVTRKAPIWLLPIIQRNMEVTVSAKSAPQT